jgi:hypothetical protein
MMKSAKWKYKDGTIRTYWDMYDDKGEYKTELGSRGKVSQGHGVTKDLYGLDEREWKNLKRVSERLQGAYRKEEKIAMEYSLMGQAFLQFKRFLPTMLKNNLQSPYKDSTQGFYAKREGEDVYTWNSRLMFGRWRLIMKYMNPSAFKALKNAPTEHKQELIHAITALGMSFAMGQATEDIFPQNSSLDKRLGFLSDSLSQGLSPIDTFSDLTRGSQMVLLTKLKDFVDNGWEFLFDGLIQGKRTQDGDIPGERGFRGTIPFIGAYDQMNRAFEEANSRVR